MRPHRSIVALVPLAFGLLACGEPATPEGPVAKSVGSAAPTPAMPALPTPDSPPPAGDAGPVQGPTSRVAADVRAVVLAYLKAAKVPDEAAMLALGTAEWQAKEKTWRKSFTMNLVKKVIALRLYEIREPVVEGEGATVSVAAVFFAEGKDDREGMRFVLAKKDGRWWITELH